MMWWVSQLIPTSSLGWWNTSLSAAVMQSYHLKWNYISRLFKTVISSIILWVNIAIYKSTVTVDFCTFLLKYRSIWFPEKYECLWRCFGFRLENWGVLIYHNPFPIIRNPNKDIKMHYPINTIYVLQTYTFSTSHANTRGINDSVVVIICDWTGYLILWK